MSNVFIHPEYKKLLINLKKLREQMAIVLSDRAYLINHKFRYLKTEYITKIGIYEHNLFDLEYRISRLTRKINIIQNAIKLSFPVNINLIEKELDIEFRGYIKKLEEMSRDRNTANCLVNHKILSKEDCNSLNSLYRSLAIRLHPDLNPSQTESQKVLWGKVLEAYESCDIKLLEIFLVIADKSFSKPSVDIYSIDELSERVRFLKLRVETTLREIELLKKKFPFSHESYLKDEKWVRMKRQELNNQINISKSVLSSLEDYLQELLPSLSTYYN